MMGCDCDCGQGTLRRVSSFYRVLLGMARGPKGPTTVVQPGASLIKRQRCPSPYYYGEYYPPGSAASMLYWTTGTTQWYY